MLLLCGSSNRQLTMELSSLRSPNLSIRLLLAVKIAVQMIALLAAKLPFQILPFKWLPFCSQNCRFKNCRSSDCLFVVQIAVSKIAVLMLVFLAVKMAVKIAVKMQSELPFQISTNRKSAQIAESITLLAHGCVCLIGFKMEG